jgi:hypothetical protein
MGIICECIELERATDQTAQPVLYSCPERPVFTAGTDNLHTLRERSQSVETAIACNQILHFQKQLDTSWGIPFRYDTLRHAVDGMDPLSAKGKKKPRRLARYHS